MNGHNEAPAGFSFVKDANLYPKEGAPDGSCQWTASAPRPVVLTVQVAVVGGLAGGASPEAFAALYCNPSGLEVGRAGTDTMGWLDLAYGSGGNQSLRRIDLREGSYQLPPCDYVRASARRYNVTFTGQLDLQIGVAITPGSIGFGYLPTATDEIVAAQTAADGELDFVRARGSRYFDVLPLADAGTAIALVGENFELDLAAPSVYPSHAAKQSSSPSQGLIGLTPVGAGSTGYYVQQEIQL